MNLQSLLEKYPHVQVASEEDNRIILEYYHGSPLSKGKDSLQYLRGNDFFAFLKERSNDYIVFLLKDDNEKIQGVAIVSYREGYINGEKTTIGYVGDLRISLNRKLIKEWRGMLTEFFQNTHKMSDTFHCKYYYTAFIHSNIYSKINLINTKIKNVKFKELASYNMYNIIGAFQLPKLSTNEEFAIEWGSSSTKEMIVDFLNSKHKNLQFGHNQSIEIERKIQSLDNFTVENFIIIKSNNVIKSINYVWDPVSTKQVVLSCIPSIFNFIHYLSKLIPFLNMRSLPIKEKPFNILYLSQFTWCPTLSEAEKEQVFKLSCHFLFKQEKFFFNVLAFADFTKYSLCRKMKGFIYQKIPMGMYTVHSISDNNEIAFPVSLNNMPPYFEMELV